MSYNVFFLQLYTIYFLLFFLCKEFFFLYSNKVQFLAGLALVVNKRPLLALQPELVLNVSILESRNGLRALTGVSVVKDRRTPLLTFFRKFYFILFYKNNFSFPVNTVHWHLLTNAYTVNNVVILKYNLLLLYNRWTNTYWLLWHFFFYRGRLLLFGTAEFKKELLAMNWVNNKYTWEEWTYINYWFIFKTNRYNKHTRLFFKQLFKLAIYILIFLNFYYHFRLVNFLKYQPFITIGLLPLHLTKSFFLLPILIFELNFYLQFYFLYFCLFIKQNALLVKYFFYYNYWLATKFLLYKVLE